MQLQRIDKQLPSLDVFVDQQMTIGVPRELALRRYEEHREAELWVDATYVVTVYRDYCGEMNCDSLPRTVMSVRRADGEPFGDWRGIQEMKNRILGLESELVQLFPAESRKIDFANLYWFYDNAGDGFPFGAKG